MQVLAGGGMGKSTQLRWFIARRCVPARIPCARIDFDVVDPVNASRLPWLLLLEIAEQLNRQIAGAPFEELLRDHGRFRPLLARTGVVEQSSAKAGAPAPGDQQARDASFRFRQALNESVGAGPVVVVFDTLEEMLLRPDADLHRFFDELGGLHDTCPSLRVALAGRYDIRERMADHELIASVRTLELEPFTPGESRQYLREVCGIARDDAVEMIAERTAGLPFTLGLFAEILRLDPDLPTDELASYDDPALLYLIERVVERTDDPAVRWLLRYGVVPRRLTLGFVTEVMGRYLRDSMCGGSPLDDVASDPTPTQRGTPAFRTDILESPDEALDVERLWRQLTDYASESSWVSATAGDPPTLVFHNRVVEPMRLVLREKPVYALLHRDAAAYYSGEATANDGWWLDLTREALYHRFQLEGPAAASAWRRDLDKAERR